MASSVVDPVCADDTGLDIVRGPHVAVCSGSMVVAFGKRSGGRAALQI